jgi:hypothetical protein
VAGHPWLSNRGSGLLYGVTADAARIAQHLAMAALGRAVPAIPSLFRQLEGAHHDDQHSEHHIGRGEARGGGFGAASGFRVRAAAGPGIHVGPGDGAFRAAVRAEHHSQRGARPRGRLPHVRVQLPVAFGFFAAATRRLAPVVATVLPALIILGVFTFVRLVETSVENVVFMRRIEAIRRYYATLDPAAAAFFASAEDAGAVPALANTGMRACIAEMFFTGASMVAAVTSILAGAAAALLLDIAGLPVPAAVIAGVGAAVLAYGLHMRWMYRRGRPAMA